MIKLIDILNEEAKKNSIEDVSLEAVVDRMTQLRKYAPYRFSGTWFIVQIGDRVFKSYRSKQSAIKHTINNKLWKVVV